MPTIYKPKKITTRSNTGNRADRKKIYNSERWRKLRAWKFSRNPLCEQCLERGRTTPAEDIHHKQSFMSTDDPVLRNELAYNYENLVSLCKKCHKEKHFVRQKNG